MTCPACTAYAKNPLSGNYRASCLDCSIRSIAQGPAFHEAQRTGTISKGYRAVLERAFCGDVKGGHAAVKEWAAKLQIKPTNGA